MTYNTIDDYILSQDEFIRPVLQQVRDRILSVEPTLQQKLAWGMPSFALVKGKKSKYVMHFAANKHHLGLYVGALSEIPFADDIIANHATTKAAIQMPYDSIDFDLVERLTKYKLDLAKAGIESK